ncbi:iron(III) transport system substrate-binding protein [Neorhizobium sp. 2083]|uniref:ABC transporter substrate-binding protein n=1 Tax=Neorhizobium sp. 2083 TaxID=2817762 RepID=UPI002857E711|nr:extracellular solute-binding protein [Neorhizobium sp. 2083]MDR6817544.1 iron(III) transport system substrate-binding protein [Neorhizobium sp. 2083]
MKHALLLTAGLLFIASAAQAQDVPAGYPGTYSKLVADAKAEGSLRIYTNLSEDNIAPVIKAFNAVYPNIKVGSLEMGPSEAFSRYRAELGTGIASADLLISNTIVDWMSAVKDGLLADYTSPEREKLPKWSYPEPGLYTFSTDPMVTIYNKITVPAELQVDTMAAYFANISSRPDVFAGKVGTYDGRYAFGGALNYALVQKHGEKAWQWLEKAGPSIKPGGGAGGMIERTLSGEFSSAYFVSAPVVFSKVADGLGDIIGWNFPKDGTVVFPRGMGITAKATHPAAAKVFLDFLLSERGQAAIAAGKLTPYRPGFVAQGDLAYSLDEVAKAVGGKENLIIIDYDRKMIDGNAAFSARWAAAFKM